MVGRNKRRGVERSKGERKWGKKRVNLNFFIWFDMEFIFFSPYSFPSSSFLLLISSNQTCHKSQEYAIWFAYLILLLKEVMCQKEGMIIPPVLPFQSLAILFYQIYQEEKYTCTRKISKNTFSWLPYLPDYQIKLTTKSILPSEKV